MFQVSGFSLPILVGDQSFKSVFARGSVGSPGLGMIVDRLELGACDLEFVCALYLVPWDFRSFRSGAAPKEAAPRKDYNSGFSTTLPATSVSRNSRPV